MQPSINPLRSVRAFWTLLFLLAIGSLSQGAFAAAPYSENGPRGIACLPRSTDAARAIKLAESTGYLVLALAPDAARADALRKDLATAGVLGRSVYVEQGDAAALPLADNTVDLVVLDDVAKSDLSPKHQAEILRVLVPSKGKATLKDQTLVKPALSGADWWTHKLRAPDNNAASRDTAFQWPPVLQFQAMPMHNAYQGAALSVNGYNIEASDWVTKDPWRSFLAGKLIVRNAHNGTLQWVGELPKNIEPMMPILAATDDTLFIALGDRAAVSRRSLADGTEGKPIEFGGADVRVRWLSVDKGILHVLIGPDTPLRTPFMFVLQPNIQRTQHKQRSLHCQTLAAYDLASGRLLWTHSEPKPNIDFKGTAVSKGRVIYYVENERLVALDAATGKEVWRNESREWIDAIKRPEKPHNWNNDYMSNLAVGEGLVRFTPFEARATILFREQTGQLLRVQRHSNLTHGGQKEPISSRDGKLFLGRRELDPATFDYVENQLPAPVGTAWCGIATYAPGIGMVGHASMGLKSPCGVGAWASGGLLHYFPTVCDCGQISGAVSFASGGDLLRQAAERPEHPLVKGPAFGRVAAPAAAKPGEWASYRADTLHRGSSPAKLPEQGAVAWTWRPPTPFVFSKHYNQHGFSFDERPVPPIIAGGRVFSAGSDGVIRAHQLADGKLLWTAAPGGPILGSLAFANGVVFAPSLDGSVHALDAASGALVWQRRLAPLDRRIHIFGKLVSTWPVLSLIVEKGRVYAVAGYLIGNGSKAFCLNAPTGEIVWSRWFEPSPREEFEVALDRYGLGGQIALVKGKLWGAGLQSVPMVLDAATGEPALPRVDSKMSIFLQKGLNAVAHHLTSLGQDIINLDDRAVLIGGGMLFENHNLRDGKVNRTNFKLFPITEDGGMLLDVARLSPRVFDTARLAPAYDDTALVFVARYENAEEGDRKVQVGNAGLNFWDKEAFYERSAALQKRPAVAEPASGKGAPVVERNGNFNLLPYSEGVWSKPDLMTNAVALAANAVVSAEATGWQDFKHGRNKDDVVNRRSLISVEGWQLAVRSRADGAVKWALPLPDEPLFNGVAVAADGTTVVVLRDGTLLATKPATAPALAEK